MRYASIAVMCALATLAIVSTAIAADQKGVKKQSSETTSSIPANNPSYGDNQPGLTIQQENKIPYQPCREALGWVNGRLRCDNRY
jgi:hypothetical protein